MKPSKTDFFLTIIIPTYNSSKTLRVALESLLIQEYQYFEVLIIDGLSNDDTVLIANEYKKKINKLTIISEKDKGIYDAMNKAITISKGNWLYFMGSDDSLYEVNTLLKIKELSNFKEYDIIYGNVISSRFKDVYDGEFTYDKIFNKNICHQAVFFKKEIFKLTGQFNLKYKAHADWDHNIKWFLNKRIKQKHVDLIIANYADGGFSSVNGDVVFQKEKLQLFLKRGLFVLPIKNILKLSKMLVYSFLKGQ